MGNSRRLIALVLLFAAIFIRPISIHQLDTHVFLPLALGNYRVKPDFWFGVAETNAELLGLAKSEYISGQWRLPLEGDTAVFFTITERDHWSTWLLCSWSVSGGWYDEEGCRSWIENNPGTIYIVGNELGAGPPEGLGGLINTTQYPQWYHEARALIKDEDPTARVAAYGPVGQITAGILMSVWESYLLQFGHPMPVDFQPVHHYCLPEDIPGWCWTKLTHWVSWLESYRGTYWTGPRDYWPLEWGLPAWSQPILVENSLALMEGMAVNLRDNDIGVSIHAWWGSCNPAWRDQCTLLVRNGQVTELGTKYLELANK